MSETRALAVRQEITPAVWQMVREIAPAMHQSRLFGVSSPEQAMVIMLKGHELGLPLMVSFEFVQVIQGKPGLAPKGALAIVHNRSDVVEVKIEESTAERCTVWMRRKDTGFEFRRTFTMAEAVKAQLVKPDSGWDKWPVNMLAWRCIGFVADVVCPDVIGGMKRADELGAQIDREGNVIEGNWTPAPPTKSGPTLESLTDQYGVEAVLAACGGSLPTTAAELELTASVLAAGPGPETVTPTPEQSEKSGIATDVEFREI